MAFKLFALTRYGPPPAPETPRMARRRRVACLLCLASVLAVVGLGPFVKAVPQAAILVAVLLLATVGINLLYWVDKNRRDAAFAERGVVDADASVLDPEAAVRAGDANAAGSRR